MGVKKLRTKYSLGQKNYGQNILFYGQNVLSDKKDRPSIEEILFCGQNLFGQNKISVRLIFSRIGHCVEMLSLLHI